MVIRRGIPSCLQLLCGKEDGEGIKGKSGKGTKVPHIKSNTEKDKEQKRDNRSSKTSKQAAQTNNKRTDCLLNAPTICGQIAVCIRCYSKWLMHASCGEGQRERVSLCPQATGVGSLKQVSPH